jgi:hypothetical protein
MLQTIWLLLIVPLSLYCFSTYIKPLNGRRNTRMLLIGILGLVYAATLLRVTYSTVFASLPHPAILFRCVRAVAGGMWTTMLISMGFRRGARTMLILSCILFMGSPLALIFYVHRTYPEIALHAILASPGMFSLEAWPVGIAIPAIILLWRSRKNGGESGQLDDGWATSEHPADNGSGA